MCLSDFFSPLNRFGFTGLDCVYSFKDLDIDCLISHKNYTHNIPFVPILNIIIYEMFANLIDEK